MSRYGALELALEAYWGVKDRQAVAAKLAGSTAEGNAIGVRGGSHFDPIVALLAGYFLDAGYPPESIAYGTRNRRCTLPGYYRPTKDWDLVVVHDGILVAAIELKSLGSPSFGNNYNNRIEEALGNATDLSRANLAGLVGGEKPWLGYFFVMEDAEKSRKESVARLNLQFDPGEEWDYLSYQGRFAISGKRLLDEGLYDAVCYLVSSPEDPGPIEPSRYLDWQHFEAAINARIGYLHDLGIPGRP